MLDQARTIFIVEIWLEIENRWMKNVFQGLKHINNSNSSHLKKMAWSLTLPFTHGIASQDCALFINYPT